MTTRLVIDCDPGTDDAFALMLAALHPDTDLLAVSTVNGNVALRHATENALRVLDHIGARVPVFAGAERPLVRPDLPVAREVLNADNPKFQVAELALPPSRTPSQDVPAVQMLIDTFLDPANADVVLVAIGPLTNIALALQQQPLLAQRIPLLVLMGGAHVGGNVTATAKFNPWADPEAARAVLAAGCATSSSCHSTPPAARPWPWQTATRSRPSAHRRATWPPCCCVTASRRTRPRTASRPSRPRLSTTRCVSPT